MFYKLNPEMKDYLCAKIHNFITYNLGDVYVKNLEANIRNVKITFPLFQKKHLRDSLGVYYGKNNKIELKKDADYLILSHELIHLASNKNRLDMMHVGLRCGNRDRALNEGMTEYINMQIFPDAEGISYQFETFFVFLLVELYSIDILKPYFLQDNQKFYYQFPLEEAATIKNISHKLDINLQEEYPDNYQKEIAKDIYNLVIDKHYASFYPEFLKKVYQAELIDNDLYDDLTAVFSFHPRKGR